MENKRIYLDNEPEKISLLVNPVEMDVDVEQEFFGADEGEENLDNNLDNDVDLFGDFEL